jgi:hypothetical protein
LTLLVYLNSFAAGFALDNRGLLLADPRIRAVTAQNIRDIFLHTYWWPTGEAGIYRPLATLSYLLNYAILGNGIHPAGYHAINLLLHSLNVLLAFALLLRLLGGFGLPLSIAAVWAVHPVLTESVTNIIGRADLIAGAAVLGGLLIYLRTSATSGWRRAPWLCGLALVAGVGTLSKESAVVLPGVILLYELTASRSLRNFSQAAIATGLPIAAALWLRASVLAASLPAEFPYVDNPIAGADFITGRLTAIGVLARYVWLVLFPLKLSSDYSYSEIRLFQGSLREWIAVVSMAPIAVAAVLLWKRVRGAFFFLCFAFLNLLPASNLLVPTGTVMAERLVYLPALGFIACAAILSAALIRSARLPAWLTPSICVVVVALFVVRTLIRNTDWHDDLSMAFASVRTSPNSFKVHRLLANSLLQSDPSHRDLNTVVAEADRSVAILSDLPDERDIPGPWTDAAAFHLAKGDASQGPEARRHYEEAARLALRSTAVDAASRAAYQRIHRAKLSAPPASAEAWRVLASSYLRLEQFTRALPAALAGQRIDPNNVRSYGQMADAYLGLGRGEEAATALVLGILTTGDQSLEQDLIRVYRAGVDPDDCAVAPGPTRPVLNQQCAIVHRDYCAAAAKAGRPELAARFACGKPVL